MGFMISPSGAAAGLLTDPPPAVDVPIFGHFRSVLAQGEGQTVTPTDFAKYEATGNPPDTFTNQQPLYVGVMPHAASLNQGDLDTYYKDTDFGSMPGGAASVESPHPGVHIYRDASYGMAHVYGDNRYDVMFGAGYAEAEERLFLMDAVRRTAKGQLAGLTGSDAASDDAAQLTDQDFSDEEINHQFNQLDQRWGAKGERCQRDILAYIDGINARINYDKTHPNAMPAEYAALGVLPRKWTVSDTGAEAILLVTQFTVSNGGEEVAAELQQAFRKRFGANWRAPYQDLREAEDPESYVVAKQPFLSDRPGPVKPGRNVVPKFGSVQSRNPEIQGPDAGQPARQSAESQGSPLVESLKETLPDEESNAVMVTRQLSADSHALAAMGPQVGYYSPQIFSEYELHGGGIDVEGVTFPGAAPWPLIGHGTDFAWSGTSANGDNQDTFAERLCNPDGSKPSLSSTHYRYNDKCVPFTMRDQSETSAAGPGASPPGDSQQITFRTMRSVHGPVFAFAKAHGHPIALAKAKAVDFHELDAAIPFMRLAENRPTSPQSFMRVMGRFPGTENWFYVDHRNVAFQQSGRYPKHTEGSDVDLPYNGDGSADWQKFDPKDYTFKSIPASHRPRALNPKDGFIISWNQKEAHGWRKGPHEWSNGPVHHSKILQRRLFDQVRRQGGHVNLVGLTRAVNLAATTDLRGDQDYPWMRKVIGNAHGTDGQLLQVLDAWHKQGSHDLDSNGDNVYEHSEAVVLMDYWWPRFVAAEFKPTLGDALFGEVEGRVLGLPDLNGQLGVEDGWDWASQVQKDLRSVLGRPEQGRYSRIYCGGPRPQSQRGSASAKSACRRVLLRTLSDAFDAAKADYGDDPSTWQVHAVGCDDEPICDQEEPNAAGAVDTPHFPWQNRGTYHQIAEVTGHR